jgi:DNA-binding response OmpR family regulator
MMEPSILIIEDDAALLRGLKDNFQTHGFRVRACADGEQALRSLLQQPPDIVLLDIMLPKLNGYEICRAARQRELTVPIIMLTAKGQEEDIIRGLELGADDYVTKPFSIRELLARVKAFLRRRLAEEPKEFRFGPCRLDLSAHKFFCHEREVELTTKEYRLLEYFLKRPGRALTRDQILDAVWGDEVIVTTRSVDRCVTTLRAKLEDGSRNIHTIRDIGYRFELPD